MNSDLWESVCDSIAEKVCDKIDETLDELVNEKTIFAALKKQIDGHEEEVEQLQEIIEQQKVEIRELEERYASVVRTAINNQREFMKTWQGTNSNDRP